MSLATDLRWALDPVAFAREALGIEPDDWQADVLRWSGQQLLLNCSRQSGKSTIAAVRALHKAVYVPGSLTLLISASLRQSAELFKKVGDLLACLPVQPALLEDNKLSLQLDNRARVVSLPSAEDTIRGFSAATLVIEDESARVDDAVYAAHRPMRATSGGQLILMSTPWGRRGHFYEAWAHGGPAWERVEVTADACPRIPASFLIEERRTLPDHVYRAEYLCEFTDVDDQVFASAAVEAALDRSLRPLFGSAA